MAMVMGMGTAMATGMGMEMGTVTETETATATVVTVMVIRVATTTRARIPQGAEMPDDRTVRISFAEDVADVAGVDPAKFRMSSGGYYVDGTGTWYMDLGAYDNPQAANVVESVENDMNDSTAILLHLSAPVDTICGLMGAWEADMSFSDVALYVHYDAAGTPDITDQAQQEMDSVGADWVTAETDYVKVDGFFPDMDPPLAIPCP